MVSFRFQNQLQSVPSITLEALITAYALRPRSSPRLRADSDVMLLTTDTPGATSMVTSALIAPISILVTVPCNTLRALIFMAALYHYWVTGFFTFQCEGFGPEPLGPGLSRSRDRHLAYDAFAGALFGLAGSKAQSMSGHINALTRKSSMES